MVTTEAGPFVPQQAATASERKREDIQRAALDLFSRDGYERTSVDAIAAAAGVSKRTVYNHFGDKENLFLAVVMRTFTWMVGLVGEILDRQLGPVREPAEVGPALVAALLEVATTVTQRPERTALLRLIIAEATRFPVLAQPWRDRGTLTDVFTNRLAQLTDRGLLVFEDRVQAMQHLSALTLNQLNTRSLWGTLPLTDAEIEQVIRSGVRVFLAAYGLPG